MLGWELKKLRWNRFQDTHPFILFSFLFFFGVKKTLKGEIIVVAGIVSF